MPHPFYGLSVLCGDRVGGGEQSETTPEAVIYGNFEWHSLFIPGPSQWKSILWFVQTNIVLQEGMPTPQMAETDPGVKLAGI